MSLPGVGGRGRSPLIRAPAPGPCPCPCRRPSVGNRRLYTAAAPAADRLCPIPPHPRPTIIVVIYSVFCVWCSKNIVFYRVLWPSPSPGFILATLKTMGFSWFWVLGRGPERKTGHLDGLGANIGPTSAKMWATWVNIRLRLAQACPYLSRMLTHLALMSAHVAHILADVGPMLAQACPYLSLMLTHVAHILADVGPMLAQACPYLSRMLTHLALLSAHVAHILADVGPMLAQACPYLSLMLTHVAHILADVGPMLAPRPSRRPVVRSGPLPQTQNHAKPMVF